MVQLNGIELTELESPSPRVVEGVRRDPVFSIWHDSGATLWPQMAFRRWLTRGATAAYSTLVRGLGEDERVWATHRVEAEVLVVKAVPTSHGAIRFSCPNTMAHWRAHHLLDREPETITWIEGFERRATFWDVGANVGAFALYAAKSRAARVIAFEPAEPSFHLLCSNVVLNRLEDRVAPLCVAVSGQTALGTLNLSTLSPAGTVHYHGEPVEDFEHLGRRRPVVGRQQQLAVTIDDLVEKLGVPRPTHVKIDVDGIEPEILAGARNTLRHPALVSVLVELDEHDESGTCRILETMEGSGFCLQRKARSPLWDRNPNLQGLCNAIFCRA